MDFYGHPLAFLHGLANGGTSSDSPRFRSDYPTFWCIANGLRGKWNLVPFIPTTGHLRLFSALTHSRKPRSATALARDVRTQTPVNIAQVRGFGNSPVGFLLTSSIKCLKCYYVWKISPGDTVTCHITAFRPRPSGTCDCCRGNGHLLTRGALRRRGQNHLHLQPSVEATPASRTRTVTQPAARRERVPRRSAIFKLPFGSWTVAPPLTDDAAYRYRVSIRGIDRTAEPDGGILPLFAPFSYVSKITCP